MAIIVIGKIKNKNDQLKFIKLINELQGVEEGDHDNSAPTVKCKIIDNNEDLMFLMFLFSDAGIVILLYIIIAVIFLSKLLLLLLFIV